jgi:hypothetical protein
MPPLLSRWALRLGLLLAHLFVIDAATGVDLDEAARRAHEQVPRLRRLESERWTRTGEQLLRAAASPPPRRDLAYEWNQYGSSDSNQYNGNQQQYHQDANGNYYEPWNSDLTETDFGFDVRSYSFKYTGCHDVGHWSQGQEEVATRYATFRLCPTESCTSASTFGCQSDYGEYIVPVDLLVTSLMEHNRARVAGYCEYCESCATVESYKHFFSEISIEKQYVVNYAETKFQTWCAGTFRRVVCSVCAALARPRQVSCPSHNHFDSQRMATRVVTPCPLTMTARIYPPRKFAEVDSIVLSLSLRPPLESEHILNFAHAVKPCGRKCGTATMRRPTVSD